MAMMALQSVSCSGLARDARYSSMLASVGLVLVSAIGDSFFGGESCAGGECDAERLELSCGAAHMIYAAGSESNYPVFKGPATL